MIFCRLNENCDDFFIHFDRGDKKTKRENKVFSFKVYTKMNVIEDKLANILAEKAADRDP